MFLILLTTENVKYVTQEESIALDELISNMTQDDTSALEKLYTKTKSAVYGFALSILKNSHNAEDVMQNTYIRIYNAAAEYKSQGKPMAWILKIVNNLALMKMRERKEKEIPVGEIYDKPSGSDFTNNIVDKTVLHAALTFLSDQERQIVVLHSISGLKHREIADVLDISLSNVLSKYHRALSKLKKHVREEA